MSATGSFFDLGPFEEAVHRDPDLVGILYTGSLGRGAADRYSDLDIDLWVTDEAFAVAEGTLRRVLGYLGAVQFLYGRGQDSITGFVGPDWQRVDLVLHRHTDMQPSPKYAAGRIMKDIDGALARMAAHTPADFATATVDQARAAIEEAIDSQIYLALHNARGAVWSAMGEISYHCAELYTLLALLRGHRSFGFRYVEQILSPGELQLMRDTWPAMPDRDEVRRAGRTLWIWTRHVWREAEATLGTSLAIQIDERALLDAVDRIY